MDGPNDTGTPEWRPASSPSGGVPSTSIASLATNLHPPRGVSMTSSDYGSTGVPAEVEAAAAYRDLAPWEASTCERLTEQIRASAEMKHFDVLPPNGSFPRTTESSLKEAAVTVQYNAKWFAEDQVETLIATAVDAVALSNSSTELLAAVKLIDTVATYSYIPQPCLPQIVRFLAQTYHGATRAVKTKRLALAAWQTFQRLLLSHLGEQCTTTLCGILETSNQNFLSIQSGYSQAAGAILLMMELFELKASALSKANIFNRVTALNVISKGSPPSLCELVMDAMCQVVEDDQARKILDDILGWDLVLETADVCIRMCPKSVEAQKMLKNIVQFLDHFETRELQSIALLIATSIDEITSPWPEELPKVASLFDDIDDDLVPQRLVSILKTLSRSKATLTQFEMFTRTGLPIVLELSRASVIEELAQFFVETANDSKTSPEINESLSFSATKLLEHFVRVGGRHLQTVFELCCKLATISPIVANIILQLRADVENGLYLKNFPLNLTFAHVNDFTPLAAWDRTLVDTPGALPQYVYALAHHVICFWYIAIKPADRKPLKNYITSCLRYQASNGREKIEDQGLVTIDLMDAVDANEENDSMPFDFYDTDGRISTLHRITGTMLITTQTALRSATSTVVIRRASGRWKRFVASTPGETPVCPAVTLESDSESFTFIVPEPDNMFTYGRIYVPSPTSVIGSADILPLRLSAELDRAIQSLDRVPGLDSHKSGVIYVGEGQTSEFEILQNSSGSPDFWELVHLLGEPRCLKEATWNTEGLDRENDLDGTSAIVWENLVTQLVFHVTPLMPKQEDSIVNKKKHIGNDAVNIIFNNSGHPFLFDTLPTQVTNVYIVISPSDRTSFLQARRSVAPDSYESSNLRDRFYNVRMLARPGYPIISPVNSEKVVSGRSLPAFVRNLVLNECVFGLMWAYRHDAPGEFPSSWRARLRQLRVISERHSCRGATS